MPRSPSARPPGADELPPPSASPVSLRGAEKIVTYAYRGRVYTDFGLRLVAGAEPFEIRSQRPTYDDQISSVWRREAGDVALPEGAMADFNGLTDFAHLTVTRVSDGEVVKEMSVDSCFNGYSAARPGPTRRRARRTPTAARGTPTPSAR